MREKEWHTYEMIVNGLPQCVRYRMGTVEHLFLPLLRRLSELQHCSGRRCIVFLAAPPATGKSTLAQFLAQLSCTEEGLTPVQALGMDGFHYPNRYLAAHTILRDGEEIPLTSIKGAPETFDVHALAAKLGAAREESVTFPVYDRRIHDVVPDAVTADAPMRSRGAIFAALPTTASASTPPQSSCVTASSPAKCRAAARRRPPLPSTRPAMRPTSSVSPPMRVRQTTSGA